MQQPGSKRAAQMAVILTLADQMVHSGTNFLTGILIGRLLSVGDFGEFSLGLTLVVFALMLQDNILATPYTYRFHNNRTANLAALRAGALLQALLMAGLCSLLLVLAAYLLPAGIAASLENIVLALAMFMPFLFVRETLRRVFFAEYRMAQALKMDMAVSAAQIGLVLLVWYSGHLSAANTFMMMAFASALISAVVIWLHRRDFTFAEAQVKLDTLASIRFGRWLLLASLGHLGTLYTLPWLLYATAGREEAGQFAACYTLINLLNPFVLGFNNYFRPKIMQTYAEKGLEAMHTLILRLMKAFAPVALCAAVFLAVAGGFLVRLVYGPEFSGLNGIMGIIGLTVTATILNAPLQLGVLALERPQIHPLFHGVAFASTLLAGVPLVLGFGMYGAAIGFSLSAISGFSMLAWLYAREIRKRR